MQKYFRDFLQALLRWLCNKHISWIFGITHLLCCSLNKVETLNRRKTATLDHEFLSEIVKTVRMPRLAINCEDRISVKRTRDIQGDTWQTRVFCACVRLLKMFSCFCKLVKVNYRVESLRNVGSMQVTMVGICAVISVIWKLNTLTR